MWFPFLNQIFSYNHNMLFRQNIKYTSTTTTNNWIIDLYSLVASVKFEYLVILKPIRSIRRRSRIDPIVSETGGWFYQMWKMHKIICKKIECVQIYAIMEYWNSYVNNLTYALWNMGKKSRTNYVYASIIINLICTNVLLTIRSIENS